MKLNNKAEKKMLGGGCKMEKLTKSGYGELIKKISELVARSRTELAKTINTKIVHTYWTI